jgi:hypothetical protein
MQLFQVQIHTHRSILTFNHVSLKMRARSVNVELELELELASYMLYTGNDYILLHLVSNYCIIGKRMLTVVHIKAKMK